MARTDARIDAYIDETEDFARPILNHLRALVHQACPDVEEAVKWSMPFFTLGGKNLANMAAFKEHAAFGFWEGLGVDTPKPVKVPALPADFAKAIAANSDAQKTYDGFPPGYRRDYILWVTEAKREQTRNKRIATAIEWMAEGKDLNWKYR